MTEGGATRAVGRSGDGWKAYRGREEVGGDGRRGYKGRGEVG